MVNRVIQAKILKMKKQRRLFPKRFSAEALSVPRYNPELPISMKTRRFDAPDAWLVKRRSFEGIDGTIPLVDSPARHQQKLDQQKMSREAYLKKYKVQPKWYDPSMAEGPLVHVVDTQASIIQVLIREWRSWKTTGHTHFVRMNITDRPLDYTLDLFVYMNKVYLFDINFRTGIGRRSMNYRTIERAKMEIEFESIRWVESVPIDIERS